MCPYFKHNAQFALHYSSEIHITNCCEFNTTRYTDAKRKCPIDRNTLHLPHAVTFLPRFYFPTLLEQSCHSFHTKVGSANHVATLPSDMRFGLADIQQNRLENHTQYKKTSCPMHCQPHHPWHFLPWP
jgi:hypothetical protein